MYITLVAAWEIRKCAALLRPPSACLLPCSSQIVTCSSYACHILSHVVTCCHMLLHVVTCCHMFITCLSHIVTCYCTPRASGLPLVARLREPLTQRSHNEDSNIAYCFSSSLAPYSSFDSAFSSSPLPPSSQSLLPASCNMLQPRVTRVCCTAGNNVGQNRRELHARNSGSSIVCRWHAPHSVALNFVTPML